MPRWINLHNRIIPTICKHIATSETLPGTCIGISIYESANLGVIIAGLQVIEASFAIVIVATIAQGVDTCQGAGCGEDFAVGIVGVGCNRVSSGVNQVEHIALGVGDVVILGAVVGQAERVAGCIVGKIKDIVSISLPEQSAASVVGKMIPSVTTPLLPSYLIRTI